MRTTFRETLWFKKGHQDAEAARKQAEGDEAEVDLLPIEDRYLDDGTLAAHDTASYGVHTGTTQAIGHIQPVEPIEGASVSEELLVAQLKTGRRIYIAMIAGGAAAIAGTVLLFIS